MKARLLLPVLLVAVASCRSASLPPLSESPERAISSPGAAAAVVPGSALLKPAADAASLAASPSLSPVLGRAGIGTVASPSDPVRAARGASTLAARAVVLYPVRDTDPPPGIEAEAGLVSPDDEEMIETAEATAPAAVEPVPEIASDIPLVTNKLVEAYIALYLGPKRDVFLRGLARSSRYREMIFETLREEGVPLDLFYLAMVESAFNPTARSYAGACGLWQFMPGTGRLYDLTVDWWIDERYEVTTATHAAARHLKDLYAEFGDWYLAMAAYNAGAGRVRKAMDRASSRDFWRLKLPAQTRNYVPAFIAAVVLGKSVERYGLRVEEEPAYPVEEIAVPEGTSLQIIAGIAEISEDALSTLNPHLRKGCVPPGMDEFSVTVPGGMGQRILAGLAALPEESRIVWERYQVRPGDTLWSVSRRTGIPVEVLRDVNRLKKGAVLKVGSELMVPRTRAVALASRGEVRGARTPDVVHKVRSGESLWSLARHFGLTVEDLMKVNNLSSTSLAVGQRLVVARAAEKPSRYQVREGDTLFAIATRHGISVSSLQEANNIGPGGILRPGIWLTIPVGGERG